jgi:hypothetical protein
LAILWLASGCIARELFLECLVLEVLWPERAETCADGTETDGFAVDVGPASGLCGVPPDDEDTTIAMVAMTAPKTAIAAATSPQRGAAAWRGALGCAESEPSAERGDAGVSRGSPVDLSSVTAG